MWRDHAARLTKLYLDKKLKVGFHASSQLPVYMGALLLQDVAILRITSLISDWYCVKCRLIWFCVWGQVTVDSKLFAGVEAIADAVEHLHSGQSLGKVLNNCPTNNVPSLFLVPF